MKRAILGWILPLELFFGLLDAFNFPRYDVSNEHLLGGGVEATSPLHQAAGVGRQHQGPTWSWSLAGVARAVVIQVRPK